MKVRMMQGNPRYCRRWGKHRWVQSYDIQILPNGRMWIENACECGAVKRIYSKNIETLQKFTRR